MLNHADSRSILAEFGKTLGISNLNVDDKGHCRLSFDDMVFDISTAGDNAQIIVSSDIGELPEESAEAVLKRYHALNYLALLMGTGAIGIDTSKNTVHYVEKISLRGLDDATFHSDMTRIISRVEKLASWLPTETSDNGAPNEQERIHAFMSSL